MPAVSFVIFALASFAAVVLFSFGSVYFASSDAVYATFSTGSIRSLFSDALTAALSPLRSCSGWNDIRPSSTVFLSVSTNPSASS